MQTKNTGRTKVNVLSIQNDINQSSMKKEIKLDDTKNVKKVNSDEIHSTHKSSVCISSFFYTQVCNLFQILWKLY